MPVRKRHILFSLIVITLVSLSFNTKLLLSNQPTETTSRPQPLLEQCLDDSRSMENDPLQIVGLGDSLTVGIGDDEQLEGYIGRLKQKLTRHHCPATIENFSQSGSTSADLMTQIKEEEAIVKAIIQADLILFTVGANDLVNIFKKHKVNIEQTVVDKVQKAYAHHIDEILTDLRTLNEEASIYVIGFYNPFAPISAEHEPLHALVPNWNAITERQVSTVEQAYFVPIDDIFTRKLEQFLAEDLFHPNPLGYERITERLFTYIQRKGE